MIGTSIPSLNMLTFPGGGLSGIHTRGLFEQVCSLENLFAAWARFKRGKSSRRDVMAYEHQLEDNLFSLAATLQTGTYRHSAYVPFIIHDPKRRLIHKATVQDRVVHQAIVQVIEPIFERRFIFDSFSCRVGKGTHAAVERLRMLLLRASGGNKRTVYVLKCDVQKFFASIDHDVLRQLLAQRIADTQLMGLFDCIIKSLQYTPGKGIPLGNLTSQLFANVYLHELDYYVKFCLREPYYVRFCDDFVIVSLSRDYLERLIDMLGTFLYEKLFVTLHPYKVTIRTWEQGIDFLGYVLFPSCTVLRTKTKKRALKRVNVENLPSYLGLCAHASAYEVEQMLKNKVWLESSAP